MLFFQFIFGFDVFLLILRNQVSFQLDFFKGLKIFGVGHGGLLAVGLFFLLNFENLFVQVFNGKISFANFFFIVLDFFLPLEKFLVVLFELGFKLQKFLLKVGSFPVKSFDFLLILVVEFFPIEDFSGDLWDSVHKHFILLFSGIECLSGSDELVSQLIDFFLESSSLSNGDIELLFGEFRFVIEFSIFLIERTFVVGLGNVIIFNSSELMFFLVDLCPYHFLLAF